MKNMDTSNFLALDERAKRSNDGFYFREFRHGAAIRARA